MDLRKIKKLIALLEESELAEMEITEGDSSIRLSRATTSLAPVSSPAFSHSAHIVSDAVDMDAGSQAKPPEHSATGNTIDSPMVGTFFDASSPDSDPYVSIGSVVKPGDTLCIIEAMKTFNQIESDVAGTVKAIYKTSGDPVEFGESLFLID